MNKPLNEIRYCLPIIESSPQAINKTIELNKDLYSFFEIWLDYLDDVNSYTIESLIAAYPGKLIFLLRRKNLEAIQMSAEVRHSILLVLAKKDCYLDLDILAQADDVEFLLKNKLNIKVIASYHNYSLTPDTSELEDILKKMEAATAAIYKISCMCQNPEDALRLLELALRLKNQSKDFIILGMGEHGKITRVFNTLWGNKMIFAPKELSKSSAPGQLSYSQLEAIFKNLG